MSYVQIRFEAINHQKSISQIKHDLRLKKPDYLRKDMYHNQFDNYIIIDKKVEDEDFFTFNNKLNRNEKYQIIKQYENHRKELSKVNLQQQKRNYRNEDSSFLTGVITLSNCINDMLKNNDITPQYLNDLFENSLRKVIKELEKEVGKSLELYYGVIHYDEKTPHLHFAIQNRTKDNKSVFNIIRKKETLSKFQDLVGEEFKQIGFNRGIKKEFTNAKHLNVTQMHQKEIEQLQQTIKELQQQKKDINDEINDILSLLKNVENDKKEDIKKLEQKIKELKNLRKQLILDIKEEKMTLKKLKLSIKNRVNKSIENHTTMGVLTNKDGLKKDIEKIVIDSLKIDVDLEKTELNNILLQQTIKEKEREIEIKDDVIKDFENTINNLQNENHTLKENTKNTTKLQKENVEQFNKIQMLKSELKDLKEENKTLKPSQTLFKRETEKREKEREISKLKDEKIEQLQQQKENVENIVSELKYELNDVKKEMKNYKEFVKSRKSEYEQFLQNRKNKNKNIGRR